MASTTKKSNGFTIVELLVVITVMGILAGIVVMAYGQWQQRTAQNVVQSDLTHAVTAMENARNFGNSYPSSIPSSFIPSANVQVSGGNMDGTGRTYCITAQSTKYTSISYMITDTNKTPTAGSCTIYNNMIGWWTFDGDANDKSGNNNNGAVTSASLTIGQNGQANGAYQMSDSSNIYVPSSSSLSNLITSGFTFSVWINRTATDTVHWPMIMAIDGDTHVYYGIRSQNYGDSISFEYGTSPYSGSTFTNKSISSYGQNQWHLVTATYAGATLMTYWDGVLINSTSSVTLNSNNRELQFMGWTGKIDDARVYNRALAASEIQTLYNAGAQ